MWSHHTNISLSPAIVSGHSFCGTLDKSRSDCVEAGWKAMFILEMWDEIRRAAHCHQACEKAEDYLAVHWLYLYTTASLNDVRPLTLQLYSMKACAFQGFTDKAISQNVRLLGCVCKMCDNCDICCHSTRLVAPT